MDRNKFRGIPTKPTAYGTDFVHGDLIRRGVHAYILPKKTICAWSPEGELTTTPIEVHQNTVGQYAGKQDKNLKEVYQGDLLIDDEGDKLEVFWDIPRLQWSVKDTDRESLGCIEGFREWDAKEIEVIGTIHTEQQ